jgi:hypothetical protein
MVLHRIDIQYHTIFELKIMTESKSTVATNVIRALAFRSIDTSFFFGFFGTLFNNIGLLLPQLVFMMMDRHFIK